MIKDVLAIVSLLCALFWMISIDSLTIVPGRTVSLAPDAPLPLILPDNTIVVLREDRVVKITQNEEKSVSVKRLGGHRVRTLQYGEMDGSLVIVLLSSDATVFCLNINLDVLWMSHIALPSGAAIASAALLVTNHAQLKGDDGAVFAALDVYPDAKLLGRNVERLRIAFDGRTGSVRWRQASFDHQGEESQEDASSLLDAEHVASWAKKVFGLKVPRASMERHAGERDARDFARQIEPLLDTWGAWRGPEDAEMRTIWLNPHAADARGTGNHTFRNALLVRHTTGLDAVHLFSGRLIFELPLEPHRLYVDANADAQPDSVEMVHVHRSHIHDQRTREGVPEAQPRLAGGWADDTMPVLRVWADVPTSHHLLDVPLVGSRLPSVVLDVVTRAHQMVRPSAANTVDSFVSSLMWAFTSLWSSSTNTHPDVIPDRVTGPAYTAALPMVLRSRRTSPLIVTQTDNGVLHAVTATHTPRVAWRHRAPLLKHEDGHHAALFTLPLTPDDAIEDDDDRVLVAAGDAGAVLLDAYGNALASVEWADPTDKAQTVFAAQGQFWRVGAHSATLYSVERQAAAALVPMAGLLVCVGAIFLLLLLLLADAGLWRQKRRFGREKNG